MDNCSCFISNHGFDPEDIDWIVGVVVHVDENGIIFATQALHNNPEKQKG